MTLFNLGIAHFTAHTLCVMQHKSTDTSDLVVGSQSDSWTHLAQVGVPLVPYMLIILTMKRTLMRQR